MLDLAANEDGLRDIAVAMIHDAVHQVQKSKSGVPCAEAIGFLCSQGAGELLEALNIDQDVVLEKLGIEKERPGPRRCD